MILFTLQYSSNLFVYQLNNKFNFKTIGVGTLLYIIRYCWSKDDCISLYIKRQRRSVQITVDRNTTAILTPTNFSLKSLEMFSVQSISRTGFPRIIPYFHKNAITCGKKLSINETQKAYYRISSTNNQANFPGSGSYYLTTFDKYILVWTKRYPSVAECPEKVSYEILTSSRSKARVKVCHYMMGSIVLLFLYVIITGRINLNKINKEHLEESKKIKQEMISRM